jgi:hypothetical protein
VTGCRVIPLLSTLLAVLAACSDAGDPAGVTAPAFTAPSANPTTTTTPSTSPAAPSTTTTATTTTALWTTTSATTTPTTAAEPAGPLRVGWIGGSEVELRDVSLPAAANALELTAEQRPVVFEALTQVAPSPADTLARVDEAIAGGAEGLIVTFNPQWLYGRVCEGVEPPHTRYACLLADGPMTGEAGITSLAGRLALSGLPVVIVLTPTSTDALADEELGPLVLLANQRLAALVPAAPTVRILDQQLTAGRPELTEGRGFHDMVHLTSSGAALVAAEVASELVALADEP